MLNVTPLTEIARQKISSIFSKVTQIPFFISKTSIALVLLFIFLQERDALAKVEEPENFKIVNSDVVEPVFLQHIFSKKSKTSNFRSFGEIEVAQSSQSQNLPSAKLRDIDSINDILAGAEKLRFLGDLELNNIQEDGEYIIGDVTLLSVPWSFVFRGAENNSNSFFSFSPLQEFSFKQWFANTPGVEFLDILALKDHNLTLAVSDIEVEVQGLPEIVQKRLAGVYGKSDVWKLENGFNFNATTDLGQSKELAGALDFLGARGSVVKIGGSLSPNVLNDLMQNKVPQPSMILKASLPTFKPRIGNLVQVPSDVQLSFQLGLSPETLGAGFVGKLDFPVGSQPVQMTLRQMVKMGAVNSFSAELTLFDEEQPWKNAFGIEWLTIEDYTIKFEEKAGSLEVEMSGKTGFGSKYILLGMGASIGAETAGLPVPSKLEFSVNDGPDKVGSLAMKDLVQAYKAISRQSGIDLDAVPDVSITGTEKGKGPEIYLEFGDDNIAAFDISGEIHLLGTSLGTIEKGHLGPDGIEIKAKSHSISLRAGSSEWKLSPEGELDVLAKFDDDTGKFLAHLDINTEVDGPIFPKQDFNFSVYPTHASFAYKSTNKPGSPTWPLELALAATGNLDGVERFEDLTAHMYVMAEMKSDPIGAIIKNAKLILDDGVKAGFQKVKTDLEGTLGDQKKKLADLDAEIEKQRRIVKKERDKVKSDINAAKKSVDHWRSKVDDANAKKDRIKARIKECNQTVSICIWSDLKCHGLSCHWECTRRETVPDVPAVLACTAENALHEIEYAEAVAEEATLQAGLNAAQDVLSSFDNALSKIPVDADPRVAGPLAGRALLVAAIKTTEEALNPILEAFNKIDAFLDSATNQKVFKLNDALITGSLDRVMSGSAVILEMNYDLLGDSYKDSIQVSLTDPAINDEAVNCFAKGVVADFTANLAYTFKFIPVEIVETIQRDYTACHEKQTLAVRQIVTKDPKEARPAELVTSSHAKDMGDDFSRLANKAAEIRQKSLQVSVLTSKSDAIASQEDKLKQLYADLIMLKPDHLLGEKSNTTSKGGDGILHKEIFKTPNIPKPNIPKIMVPFKQLNKPAVAELYTINFNPLKKFASVDLVIKENKFVLPKKFEAERPLATYIFNNLRRCKGKGLVPKYSSLQVNTGKNQIGSYRRSMLYTISSWQPSLLDTDCAGYLNNIVTDSYSSNVKAKIPIKFEIYNFNLCSVHPDMGKKMATVGPLSNKTIGGAPEPVKNRFTKFFKENPDLCSVVKKKRDKFAWVDGLLKAKQKYDSGLKKIKADLENDFNERQAGLN